MARIFFKSLLLLLIVTCLFDAKSYSQQPSKTKIRGSVSNISGTPISSASIVLKGSTYGTTSNAQGQFEIEAPFGNYVVLVGHMGYKSQEVVLNLKNGISKLLNVVLKENNSDLNEVAILGKTKSQEIKETGFSVESVDTKLLQGQSIQVNRLLDWTPGIRVRQEAGMGSKYNYSINGMSGNSVSFFIDGIPMHYFGSSYTINNLPISLINRMDIYKGVVPVELGSDALGGAINVVTNVKNQKFLEASYSYGSFNSHQAVLNGQYTDSSTNFTMRFSGFRTYSDNDYEVWGRGVNYADASTGFQAVDFTKDKPAKRFNDDFKTLNGKMDLGFIDKKWADQFFISLLASSQTKGIQTGQTMATVYGELHYKERLLMPHVSYQKSDLLTKGLNLNIFSGYTHREGTTVDTAMSFYNWKGGITPHDQGGGEIARNGKSLYTMYENSWVNRLNLTYQLADGFKLGINYLNSITKRRGDDPYQSDFRVPLIAPQHINTQFAGLSLETKKFRDRLSINTFLKWYDFNTTSNELEYVIVDGVQRQTVIPINNRQNNWGGGLAASFKINPRLLAKFSVEQATRLPTPTEALGNGILVVNNPDLKPEQSLNMNLGLNWGRLAIGGQHGLTMITTVFYRDTKDQILYNISGRDEGMYQNIGETKGKGIELEVIYDFNHWLKVNANFTYLDIRNNQRLDNGVENILFGDRLRNTPYLLGNAGASANFSNIFQKDSKLFVYLHTNYVHAFYLSWPSLGSQNKKEIPSQLVSDAGVGYTFPKRHLSLAFDLSNFTNTQAYDNFLLQKPGRAAFVKLTYLIKNLK